MSQRKVAGKKSKASKKKAVKKAPTKAKVVGADRPIRQRTRERNMPKRDAEAWYAVFNVKFQEVLYTSGEKLPPDIVDDPEFERMVEMGAVTKSVSGRPAKPPKPSPPQTDDDDEDGDEDDEDIGGAQYTNEGESDEEDNV